MSKAKKITNHSRPEQKFSGAASIARRRAFRAKQPVVILENGKIYRVYADGTWQEVVASTSSAESG